MTRSASRSRRDQPDAMKRRTRRRDVGSFVRVHHREGSPSAEPQAPGTAGGRADPRAVGGLDERRPASRASRATARMISGWVQMARSGALGMSRFGLRTTRAPGATKALMPPSGASTARRARVDRRRLVRRESVNGDARRRGGDRRREDSAWLEHNASARRAMLRKMDPGACTGHTIPS